RLWQSLVSGPPDPGADAPWAAAWVGSGVRAAAPLTAPAVPLDRPPRSRPPVAAPALLGAPLLGLVVLDLVLGGHGLSQPLVGGSAWDGERFYGPGKRYVAFALSAVRP